VIALASIAKLSTVPVKSPVFNGSL